MRFVRVFRDPISSDGFIVFTVKFEVLLVPVPQDYVTIPRSMFYCCLALNTTVPMSLRCCCYGDKNTQSGTSAVNLNLCHWLFVGEMHPGSRSQLLSLSFSVHSFL